MCLFKFKSNLANRIATAKTIGFIIWLIAFFLLPVLYGDIDLMLRFWILFWYATLWWIIWVFGIMNKHPVFPKWKFPFWFRWIFLWAWMNFLLVLFAYNQIAEIFQTLWYNCSPFLVILEWAIIWLIIDFFATKSGWDGKQLLK